MHHPLNLWALIALLYGGSFFYLTVRRKRAPARFSNNR
jgi:hypothetical protein